MNVKNKHVIRSRISEKKFREIVKYFSVDLNAVQIHELTGLSRQTINKYLVAIRLRIVDYCHLEFTPLKGQIEVDESYFGARRVKGRRGRGARGKTSIDSVIHSDGWRGYNGLVDFGYKKHFRVHHGKNEFARGNAHINGTCALWV